MDLFNKKKLKEKEEWLDEVIEDRNKWEKAYINQVKDTNQLIENNNRLTEENQKLIDWIEKIINEVGVKTNCKDTNINIPYYEDIRYEENRIAGNYENDYFPRQERKDIIIPSIRFTKYE